MDSGVIISEDINCLFQGITGMNKARESLQILDNSINTENEKIANGLETYDDNLVVKTVIVSACSISKIIVRNFL